MDSPACKWVGLHLDAFPIKKAQPVGSDTEGEKYRRQKELGFRGKWARAVSCGLAIVSWVGSGMFDAARFYSAVLRESRKWEMYF